MKPLILKVLKTAFVLGLLFSTAVYGQTINGSAYVIDADTLKIKGQSIRLEGIDAPEINQNCLLNGKNILCGLEAKNAFIKKINNQHIRCSVSSIDRYKRFIATCYLNSEDLNAWLVRRGYALAYRKYSTKYVYEENMAKSHKTGIWNTKFKFPWEFRRGQKP